MIIDSLSYPSIDLYSQVLGPNDVFSKVKDDIEVWR